MSFANIPAARPALRRSASRFAWARVLLAVLFAAALAGGGGSLSASPAPSGPGAEPSQAQPISLAARAGFDGYYKETRWIPVRISVANDGPDVSGVLQIEVSRISGSAVIVSRPVELPTQSRREIFLYVPTEGFTSSLTVTLLRGNAALADVTARVSQVTSNDLVYGVIAAAPSAFNVLASIQPVNGQSFVAQLELADLPSVVSAWQTLDVLILSDVDTGALSPEQRAALEGWLAAGGRLIVAGGPAWQRTASGLGGLLPLTPSGAQNVTDLSAMAAYAASDAPAGGGLAAVGTLAADATALVSVGGAPLVAARDTGFGRVYYLALDPAFDPLRNWDGLEGMYRSMLAGAAQQPVWAGGIRNWYAARDAVNAVPGLEFPSALQVCGFLAIYLIAVGPLNYFVLKRLKRRELAWATIPVIVLVFSLAAYFTGNQLRGVLPLLHRMSVVQVWPESDVARVDEAIGLYSPRRSAYDLAFPDGFLARPMPVDQLGSGVESFTLRQADQTQVDSVRLEAGGLASFAIQGQAAAPRFESDLVMQISHGTATLAGTITNGSNVSLADVVLLAPGGVARLGDLAPGATLQVNLPLNNARAAAGGTGGILPASSGQGSASSPSFSSPSVFDSTIDDILGSSNYYDDRDEFRRYSLLSSIIDVYSGAGRGGGVYLAGWAASSPVSTRVTSRAFSTADTVLYLIAVRPKIDLSASPITIPPGLMTWTQVGSGQSPSATPYDMYLYQSSEFTLRFEPYAYVPYRQTRALTLHLTSYGLSGVAGIDLELWNFADGQWALQPQLTWGDNDIAAPERYVGSRGEIEVRVTNSSQPQLSLERLDFTLLAEY